MKQREKYHRRKAEKKQLPISTMPVKAHKSVRKRNRANFKAYWQRKKQQKEDALLNRNNRLIPKPKNGILAEEMVHSAVIKTSAPEVSTSDGVTNQNQWKNQFDAMKFWDRFTISNTSNVIGFTVLFNN